MKKLINKIWLITLPIAGLAIGVPIIASSCSAITNSENNSAIENPTTSLEGDDTNRDSFDLNTESNTLYSTIRNVLVMAYPEETDIAISAMIKKYVDIKQEDIKDIIKMWSFNKWFDTKNKNELSKPISSKIDIINIQQNANQWKIEFDYNFELIDSNNTKIFGQKRYTLNSALSSNVTFTTTPIKFEINGIDQLSTLNKQSYSFKNSNVLEKAKQFLNENNSVFDANKIIKEFLNKKNINGNLGTWNVSNQSGISLNDDKKHLTIDLNELNGEWNGLKQGLTKEQIKDILIDKTNSGGNRLGDIKEIFKNLINDNKKILGSFNVFDGNNSSFLTLSISLIRRDGNIISNFSLITIKNYIN